MKTTSLLKFLFLLILLSLNTTAQTWEGKWVRKGGCELTITKFNDTCFEFSFSCMSANFSGVCDSKAVIKGNIARFDGVVDGLDFCPINFTLDTNSIDVEEVQNKECENCLGNVDYTGKYKRIKINKNLKVKK